MNAKASSCLDKNSFAAKLSYQWQITPSAGITIPNMISPTLVIPAKELIGGRTYQATVVVSMQQDDSLFVTQSATIVAQSSEVEAVISGVQTMSIAETLELSGENSNDPDGNKAGDKVSYMWDIVNSDRSAVISRKSRKRLRFPKTAKLSLPGRGNLEAGKTYKFRLTYRVGKRVGIAEHKVKVIECETCVPPVVSLLVIFQIVNKRTIHSQLKELFILN